MDSLEKNVMDVKGVTWIHKIFNHKMKDQMVHSQNQAEMLTDEVRQIIDDIAEKCEFCKQNSKSKSK